MKTSKLSAEKAIYFQFYALKGLIIPSCFSKYFPNREDSSKF